MSRSPWSDIAVGTGVGGLSGFLGIGGGIFLVPYLTTIGKVPQKPAQATSLVLVFMGAASATIMYGLQASVAWIPALLILVGGLAGVFIGSSIMLRSADHVLRIIFGIVLILVAIRMMFPSPSDAEPGMASMPELTAGIGLLYVASGVFMGAVSALLGVGGGIILVPILVTILGYHQQLANGTSLAVMTVIALLGAMRFSREGLTDWRAGLVLGSGAVIGAFLGAAVALELSSEVIRLVFAILLGLIGANMVREGVRMRRANRVQP